MDTNNFKLKAAFAGTDTIEYGGFKIVKANSGSWDDARVSIDGQSVQLTPKHTFMLALLVAYKGEFVPKTAYGFSQVANEEGRNSQYLQKIKKEIKHQTGIDISGRIVAYYPQRGDFKDPHDYLAHLGNYRII